MSDYDAQIQIAVDHFWSTLRGQAKKQGSATGKKDQGARSAVTGGKQMDGFVELVRDIVVESGIPEASVHCQRKLDLPGYFRPEKRWDLLVVVEEVLLATIEFKSHVGPSFGNNFNNRTEEAIGNATDLWTAYREGAFKPSDRPWVGFLMLLEDSSGSTRPVSVRESHFPVFEEFREASYAKRYEIMLTRFVRERLYDSACLIMSERGGKPGGSFHQPSVELSFENLATSLSAKAIAFARSRK